MEIQNVIVHRLLKERYETSRILLRKSELPVSEALKSLMEKIRDTYSRTTQSSGRFMEDQDNYPFSQWLLEFMNKKVSFPDFTEKAMNRFKVLIDIKNLATGGCVLFVVYKEGQGEYLMVMMLNDTWDAAISEDLEIQEVAHLDLSKLHVAARINITTWREKPDSERYLSFVVRKGQTDVSDYFQQFIGCTDTSSAREQSKGLVNAVGKFCQHKGFSETKATEFRQSVFLYCEERRENKEPVDLKHLSMFLNQESPEEFLQYANSEECGVSGIITPQKKVLMELTSVSLIGDGIRLNFPRSAWGKKVVLGDDGKSLIITNLSQAWLEKIKGG
ncbi:MAG: nucleoid-associated protein [Magnetococcus sp. THC-1_WYH]